MVGGEEELFTVNAQDTITVLYDTATGTLSFAINDNVSE